MVCQNLEGFLITPPTDIIMDILKKVSKADVNAFFLF